MGEKGNVADVAQAAAAGGAQGGVIGSVVSGAGGLASSGASAVADVAGTTRDKLVEMAADHTIAEGRERLRRDPETGEVIEDDGPADAPPA